MDMGELFEIGTERRPDSVMKVVTYVLRCPMCKIGYVRNFNTSECASEEEIDGWIGGDRESFYYSHVLDCSGGRK